MIIAADALTRFAEALIAGTGSQPAEANEVGCISSRPISKAMTATASA